MGYFRKPKTTQERRHADEYTRAKRSHNRLVNAWDDITHARQGRTWKNHRRTQWK